MKAVKRIAALVLALLLLPTLALAADFRTDDNNASISSGTTINDDLYIASGMVTIAGTINGDLIMAGGQLRLNGVVTGDVMATGGEIILGGTVGGSVRVAGGSITLNGGIGKDLLVGGGQVTIEDKAVIKGEVLAGAGQLTIAGRTGTVKAAVGDLIVRDTAQINGDLSYRSDKEATIAEGGVISGQTNFNRVKTHRRGLAALATVGALFSLLSTILLAWLFLFFFPHKTRALTEQWPKMFGWNVLVGFLFMIATPIAVVVLLISLVGTPLGIGLVILYPVLFYLAKLVGVLVVGSWLERSLNKGAIEPLTWLSAVAGAIVVAILTLIPVLGWMAYFLLLLASLGALLRFDWKLLGDLRRATTI